MPKIPPRPEIVSHPLYQATMAAQHAAYKIARELPPDRKAEGARVHVACVHATTWATYALEPGAPDRAAALDNVRASAEEARRKLEPVAAAAADENDVEALTKALDEIEKALAEVESPATPVSSFPG